jgi:hypothetical protein
VKRLTVTCTCSSFHSERCRDVIPRLLQGNRLAPHRDLCRVLDRPNPLRQCLHELLDLLLHAGWSAHKLGIQSLHGTVRHQHGWHHCRLGPHGAWYRTKVCRRSLPTNLEMALMRFQNPLPLRLYLDVHHSGRHWWRLTRTLHRGILGRRWLLAWSVAYQFTVGTVCFSLMTEIPSRRLVIKTVNVGRGLYCVANIVIGSVTPYMLNPYV